MNYFTESISLLIANQVNGRSKMSTSITECIRRFRIWHQMPANNSYAYESSSVTCTMHRKFEWIGCACNSSASSSFIHASRRTCMVSQCTQIICKIVHTSDEKSAGPVCVKCESLQCLPFSENDRVKNALGALVRFGNYACVALGILWAYLFATHIYWLVRSLFNALLHAQQTASILRK